VRRSAGDCGLARKAGHVEYVERFAENKIDVSVLRHITDQDLKDIGVALGHRRKMLAAIAEVAGAELTSLQPASTEPRSSNAGDAPSGRSQRHGITWLRMKTIADRYMPRLRILHPWLEQRLKRVDPGQLVANCTNVR
jgi:uncharacterized protein YjiS (DUF1127 family)